MLKAFGFKWFSTGICAKEQKNVQTIHDPSLVCLGIKTKDLLGENSSLQLIAWFLKSVLI